MLYLRLWLICTFFLLWIGASFVNSLLSKKCKKKKKQNKKKETKIKIDCVMSKAMSNYYEIGSWIVQIAKVKIDKCNGQKHFPKIGKRCMARQRQMRCSYIYCMWTWGSQPPYFLPWNSLHLYFPDKSGNPNIDGFLPHHVMNDPLS